MNFKELKFRAKNLVGNNFIGFKYITKKYAKRQFVIINEKTDITIEGYPRSGNTFAVAAFDYAQEKSISIARHRHESGQVIMAVKLKKPVLVICRKPIDAVVSLVIREGISVKYALQYYIEFYKKILPYNNHILFIDFKDVITDMGEVIEKINTKYKTDFSKFKHTKENVDQVKKKVVKMDKLEIKLFGGKTESTRNRTNKLGFPSKKRDQIKNNLKHDIINDTCYFKLLFESEEVYQKCLNTQSNA
jgi:hypothetical protein